MSKILVRCKTCASGPIAGEFEVDDHGLIAAILWKIHSAGTHAGAHELEVLLDGQPITLATRVPGDPARSAVAALDGELAPAIVEAVRRAVGDYWSTPVHVEAECLAAGCCGLDGNARRRWKVPRWFAPAMPVLHHAAHEGHPFKLWIDGVEVAVG